MAEYIEREPLIKYCTAMFNLAQRLVQSGYAESDIWKGIHQTQQEERKEFLEILKSASSADVTPVRHGRWIDSSNGWMCSVCERDSTYDTPYCPHCGARMDKEDEHEVS